MDSAFSLTIDPKGIARLVFDLKDEKVNKINIPVLEELNTIIEGIAENQQVKALVITSAKNGIFIAGADLTVFESLFSDPPLAKKMITLGHEVFDRISQLPFPSIAVIDGACLGGGMELALACTYRVVTDNPKTQLGLPETTLGIFPGWGGTQRLPRLVGLRHGLTMILTGKSVNAKKAWKIGLADSVVAKEFQKEQVEEFVQSIIKKPLQRRKRTGIDDLLLEKNPIGRALFFWQAKKNVLKETKGHYPAPLRALELVKKTYTMPLKKGLETEIKMFLDVMKTEFSNARNLIQLFFTSEKLKRDPGAELVNSSRSVRSVGVIGAGTMGSGIAWLMSYRDIPVRMKDINWKVIGHGFAEAWKTYQVLIKKRKLTPNQANRKFHALAGIVDYKGFQDLDLVIEAAVEEVGLKNKILAELESEMRSDAIIATNTSSLTLKELARGMKRPERLVGMHFFNPPGRMPLVEVVAGDKTSPEVLTAAVELCRRLKKTAIVVKDCSGFIVNRVFARGFVELLHMLEEGVDLSRLDNALLRFGFPMAPFLVADQVGNDVNEKAMNNFQKAYGDRMKIPPILNKLNEKKLYGKKSGKGFYIYNKKTTPNPQIKEIIGKTEEKALSDLEITDRVVLAMVLEASLCLEENIIANAPYLDMALILGIGFPPFRGGALRYADEQGIPTVVRKVKDLEQKLGPRFTPTDQLMTLEKEGKTFYS